MFNESVHALPSGPISCLRRVLVAGTLALSALAMACSPSPDGGPRTPEARNVSPPATARIRPGDPYAFSTPAPPATRTTVDGTYTRTVSEEFAGGPPVPCRRCAPYRVDPGRAELELHLGRFRLAHERTTFRSSGHFTVSGDRFFLFNDPNCPEDAGIYVWTRLGASLTFETVADECASGQRSRYLTALPWTDVATAQHPVHYFDLTDAEALEELGRLKALVQEAVRRRSAPLAARAFRDGSAGERKIERLVGELRRRRLLDRTSVGRVRASVRENFPTRVEIDETRLVYPCLMTEDGKVATRGRVLRQRLEWILSLENISWYIEDFVLEHSEPAGGRARCG